MIADFKGYTFGFIGGDKRISLLASIMKKNGYKIREFGLFEEKDFLGDVCSSVEELFSFCDIIILPVPVSRDKSSLFAEKQGVELRLENMIPMPDIYGKKIIFGGLIPKNYHNALLEKGHTVIDIFNNPRLIFNNAIATAEGGLMIAMQNSDSTVISSNFGVLGFGRIASHLSKIISLLGGNVTVFARGERAIEEAEALGYKTFRLSENQTDEYMSEMASELDAQSVIFNTVPSVIINKEIISRMLCRPLYIELASYPYGIDSKDAREMNFNTIYAPSLPGRYSPRSAAEYIFEAIIDYLNQIDN